MKINPVKIFSTSRHCIRSGSSATTLMPRTAGLSLRLAIFRVTATFFSLRNTRMESESQPSLLTPRLVLRPLESADAPAVQAMCSEKAVAATTASIPHPYPENGAASWILTLEALFLSGRGAIFGIALRESDELVGACGINLTPEHRKGELGYWIGMAYWNNGYAAEAAACVIDWAFRHYPLLKIGAHHLGNNPSSGRVLQKIGMRLDGVRRKDFIKWGESLDVLEYSMLREEWLTQNDRGNFMD